MKSKRILKTSYCFISTVQRCNKFKIVFGSYSFNIVCKCLLSFVVTKEFVHLLEFKCFIMKKSSIKKLVLLFVFFISTISFAQNTLQYNDEKGSPSATLQDVKWLAGNWKGTSPFGICQENWDTPSGNTMMFCFKMLNADNKVSFYELGHIIEKDKTLLLQIRHFGGDMKAWETGEVSEDFKFIKIEKNRIYFDRLTYEKISDNAMNVYVYFEESKEEIKFSFTK